MQVITARHKTAKLLYVIWIGILASCIPASPVSIELENTGLSAGGEGTGGTNLFNPVWSHDGQLLAYKYDFGIWIVDTQTWENPQKLYDIRQSREDFDLLLEPSQNLVWSPDDQSLGFTLSRITDDGFGTDPLVAQYNLQNGEVSLPLGDEQSVLVDWNKRGLLTCFNSQRRCEIVDPNSGERQELNDTATPLFFDEDHLIYADYGSIFIQSIDSEEIKVIDKVNIPSPGERHPYSRGSRPVASPNGELVAWVSRVSSTFSREDSEILTIYNRANKQTANFHLPIGSLPSWSPDSKKLAFLGEGTVVILHFK